MIKIEIPGTHTIEAEHLVLDYNGTLAIDGVLIPGVKEMLNSLADKINIHVITADTFGSAHKSLEDVQCRLAVIHSGEQKKQKEKYISELTSCKVIAIGNGANDALMLKKAALGIILIQQEGASVQSLINADIACNSINDALDLLNHPVRIAATLRN